jgi:hypothetical protein
MMADTWALFFLRNKNRLSCAYKEVFGHQWPLYPKPTVRTFRDVELEDSQEKIPNPFSGPEHPKFGHQSGILI